MILSTWSITAGGGQIITNKHKSNQYNEEGFWVVEVAVTQINFCEDELNVRVSSKMVLQDKQSFKEPT